jgi:hypothetical protein
MHFPQRRVKMPKRFARLLIGGCFLSPILMATVKVHIPSPHPGRPGTINYVEGQAYIGPNALAPATAPGIELERNQTLSTQAGKLEMLLTPGVFLRLADNSTLTMISPELANTQVRLERGRAMIEVLDIRKENDIRILVQNGSTTKLLKKGLYDFDAGLNEVRVFRGSAEVTAGTRHIKLGDDHKVAITDTAALRSVRFESRQYEDEFYRWSGLRSGYLSEASVNVAGTYIGPGPGWYGPGWYGWGWYWDPWFGVYTFVPADGIFWGPFGFGFYSPIAVYSSPYRFYGPNAHAFGEYHYPYGHGLPEARGRR